MVKSFSHHFLRSGSLPAAVAPSAYQICFTSGESWVKLSMRGLVARA